MIIQQKVPPKYTYTSCQIYELKLQPTANCPFRIPPQRAYEKRPKERTKPEPKSVHVASRTNLYYLNETKSMNAQVKFPFCFRSTPFPFALKNVRVAFLLFRRVALSLRCRFVALPFRCVCIPFRCVCRFVAFAFRFVAFAFHCEAFCGVCVQSHLHTTNCKAPPFT